MENSALHEASDCSNVRRSGCPEQTLKWRLWASDLLKICFRGGQWKRQGGGIVLPGESRTKMWFQVHPAGGPGGIVTHLHFPSQVRKIFHAPTGGHRFMHAKRRVEIPRYITSPSVGQRRFEKLLGSPPKGAVGAGSLEAKTDKKRCSTRKMIQRHNLLQKAPFGGWMWKL